MRKMYFFGIGIVLISLAGWGIYTVYKPHRNVESDQAVATLTATNLYSEFLNGESIANKKWVGKVIEITGVISSVSEAGSYISVNLSATADGGVNCSILKKDLPPGNTLNKGDSVTIKGKCTGFLMDVNIVDCVIKK
jgi:tRNA_anti-like